MEDVDEDHDLDGDAVKLWRARGEGIVTIDERELTPSGSDPQGDPSVCDLWLGDASGLRPNDGANTCDAKDAPLKPACH